MPSRSLEERRPCRSHAARLRHRMSDVQARKRINVHDDYELRFWSKKFGVSPNELRCACKLGLEGIVSKKLHAPYQGRRKVGSRSRTRRLRQRYGLSKGLLI